MVGYKAYGALRVADQTVTAEYYRQQPVCLSDALEQKRPLLAMEVDK